MMRTWPQLPFEAWTDTCATLHLWTQIVGKLRLRHTPLVNHWWNVPLYVSARGLETTVFSAGDHDFDIAFDFIDHRLVFTRGDGHSEAIPLVSKSVAAMYGEIQQLAARIGLDARINPLPCELPAPISFPRDEAHHTYVPEHAHALWRAVVECDRVFKKFRAGFIGKCSPVHFFWGSFDLAVTRFSGRPAPARENADAITREAYSHEVISHGFWPGNADAPTPVFYAYCAPEPPGFRDATIAPAEAAWNAQMSEFLLPYEAVRQSADPDAAVLSFMRSTYEAGAAAAKWDSALIRST